MYFLVIGNVIRFNLSYSAMAYFVWGEYDTGERYYDHWLTALERVVVEKNLAGWEDLAKESETIREHDHHNREHQLEGLTSP